MKICLMAAASAMLLAGCSTKDNAAGTTAVETTAKEKVYWLKTGTSFSLSIQKKQKKQIRQPRQQSVKLQKQQRKTVNWI